MSWRSAPVRTQTTPGTRSAAAVSIEAIRPWAIGLRSTLPWSIRGTSRSPTNSASPRSFSRASRLGCERPTCDRVSGTVVVMPPPSCRRELGDRLEDAPVTGATAEVAGQSVLDLLLAAELAVLEQRVDGQEHARRAEAALQRGVAGEDVLHPGELRLLGEALDRGHVLSVSIRGQVAARADGKPVDEDRAGAADLNVARALRPRQPERVSEQVEQQL